MFTTMLSTIGSSYHHLAICTIYHINVSCVKMQYPDFYPQAVKIPPDVRECLLPPQKIMFYKILGIS